jgi:hypothetical protein
MSTIANAESRTVFVLVSAFEDRQITLDELMDGLGRVSSEALQVAATFGMSREPWQPFSARLGSARRVCQTLAAAMRSLS